MPRTVLEEWLVSKEEKLASVVSWKPNEERISRLRWSTVSNAASRSSKMGWAIDMTVNSTFAELLGQKV